jgi:hypothetical protein
MVHDHRHLQRASAPNSEQHNAGNECHEREQIYDSHRTSMILLSLLKERA